MRFLLFLPFLFIFVNVQQLSYDEKLQFLQLQNGAYNAYLRNIAQQKQRFNVYKSWYAATTEFPPLKSDFFENDTVVGESQPNSAYISMGLVYSNPRTVDDDIGMPLNQPFGTKQKINFYNYGKLYSNYYRNGK